MGGFRKILISWGGKILLLLLILSFGLWGITDYISPGATLQSVASVGGIEITRRDLQREVENRISDIRRGSGLNLDRDQARAMGLIDQGVESLIQRQLIALTAEDMGLLVDDELIRAEVHATRNFQTPDGRFSRDRFNQVMRQAGLDEARYLAMLRFELLSRQFLSNLQARRGAPKTLLDAVYRHRAEKRVAQVLRIDHTKIAAPVKPTAANLREFHQKQAGRFTAPEYRSITLVRVKPETVIDRVKVGADKIKQEYDNRLDEFSTPERRTLRQILLGDEARAKKAAARLAAGEDFLKVAKEEAKMDAAQVEIGTFERAAMPLPALAETAFGLSLNGTSGPVKSELGWHIVKVTKIAPPTKQTFQQASQTLRKEIAREKALDMVFELSNKLEDALGGGANLEEAARGLNLPLKRIAALSPIGRDMADKQALDPSADRAVIKAAFETPKGNESALSEAGDADIFILRVDGIIPPALRPFASVRARIVTAWTREQKIKAARNLAKKALDMAKGGRKWADIAKQIKAETYHTKPMQRTGAGLEKSLPASIIADLFRVKRGEAVAGGNAEAQFLARTAKVVPAEPAREQKEVKKLSAELGESIGNDLANQLVLALRQRHGVTVNRAAIAQVY